MNGSAAQCEESAEQGMYRATGTEGATARESRPLFGSGAGGDNAAALKKIAAERLAAHRNRRAAVAASEAERDAEVRARVEALRRENSHGASRVRDAVAARYQQSVSYREYLAAEAERALEQAQAEAEVAARKAQAVAEAQMKLLEEIEQWSAERTDAPPNAQPELSPRQRAIAEQRATTRDELAHELADLALGARELIAEGQGIAEGSGLEIIERLGIVEAGGIAEMPGPALVESRSEGLQVRLHERLSGPAELSGARSYRPGESLMYAPSVHFVETDELDHLDEEIEFRRAPEFADHALEALPIQANIIEFPRQLIAARKARPRLAEGPLREDAPPAPQLRIFEVEAEQISFEPEAAEVVSAAPEWQGLLLDVAETESVRVERDFDARLRPEPAPLSRRLMALTVDGCCVGCGLVGFAALVAGIAGPALRGMALPVLGGAAAATLLLLGVLYQVIFFSLAGTTPGMRYARIGLCTFNDENPTRKAMRRRILALLLAACPVGLGLVWIALDDDSLGWHDRISRMYPRAY